MNSRCGSRNSLTSAVQYVSIFLDAAIMTSPTVDNPTMNSQPSARPQTSTSFATGMYNAEVMAPETVLMVVKSE